MAGGLVQIIAYGAQDMYLTNNPQITYFKTVYKRHTNFSIEAFEYTVLPVPKFGSKRTVKILRNGDLITKMHLRIVISRVELNKDERFAWVRRLGYALLNAVDLDIGGVKVDRQCGMWLDVWHELARSSKHDRGFKNMIGDVQVITEYNNRSKPEYVLYIPLKFWFNRYYGLALPMIGIHYHEVRLHIEFNKLENLIVTNSKFDRSKLSDVLIYDVSVLVDYIYLDTDERHRFAYGMHEYLVEQVQTTEGNPITNLENKVRLYFNHPVKEIMWLVKNGNYNTNKRFLCYTDQDDWTTEIYRCSQQILRDSIYLSDTKFNPGCKCDNSCNSSSSCDSSSNSNIYSCDTCKCSSDNCWEEFPPDETERCTKNMNISIINNGSKTLFVNTDSLKICEYSITNKLNAKIVVDHHNCIQIDDFCTNITIEDISVPVECMTDNRVSNCEDVFVNQFSNYGMFIDGSVNPVKESSLEFNDDERVPKRSGTFTNYLHPDMHHSNTPKDGINCYCFSLKPEIHQPMGTANFSKIENVFLKVWLKDNSKFCSIVNEASRLFVYGLNYNVFRVINGLTGMSYSG